MIPEAEMETPPPTHPAALNQSDSIPGTDGAPPRKRWGVNSFILAAFTIALLAVGVGWYMYAQGYEDTDDAQVDGHLNPIASRIDGTIKSVHVDDNRIVQVGEVLVDLDPSDDEVTLQQSQAQYDQAVAQLGAAHPNLPITQINNRTDLSSQHSEVVAAEATLAAAQHDLESAIAKLKEAQTVSERNDADFTRYQQLFDKQEVSRAEFDQYKATATAQLETVVSNQATVASEQETVEQRRAQLVQQQSKLRQTQISAPFQVAIREADIKTQQANTEAAQAMLRQSRLNVSYTRIAAPVTGVMTQRAAEVGARVSKGQQLFMIVQTDDLWVTANFKETQMFRIHPGQHVRIHVDALREDFDGTVASMPAVTGSRTSVLPPENATGNYVKVIQRLPVRIVFVRGQSHLDKLRPGMSVEPKVKIDRTWVAQ